MTEESDIVEKFLNEMEYDPNDITIEFGSVSEEELDRARKAIAERGELSEMQMQVYQKWA